jgi:hypothetical protein
MYQQKIVGKGWNHLNKWISELWSY